MVIVDCRLGQEEQFWILDGRVSGLDRQFVVVEEKAGSQRTKEVLRRLRWWQQVCWRRGRGLEEPTAQERDLLQAWRAPARKSVDQLIIVVLSVVHVSNATRTASRVWSVECGVWMWMWVCYLPCEQRSCLETAILSFDPVLRRKQSLRRASYLELPFCAPLANPEAFQSLRPGFVSTPRRILRETGVFGMGERLKD
jgi:hypothetical protein